MRNTAVVTDEDSILQDRCEMRQRKIDRKSHRRFVRPQRAQLRDLFFIRFATDNDQHAPARSTCSPSATQFSIGQFFVSLPLPDESQRLELCLDKKFLRCFSVAFVRKEERSRIDQCQPEFLHGSRQLTGSVFASIKFR